MRARTRTILAGLVLAAALVGGVAWATIPGAAGVINGCYRTSLDDQKGQLRIVDDPTSCRSTETAIQWNQEGPKGDTGARGIPGPNGEKGETGAAGPAGPDGAKGETGAAGPVGAAGANGTNGLDGADGTNGTNGVDGTNGTRGVQGLQGPAGPTGPAGTSTGTIQSMRVSGPTREMGSVLIEWRSDSVATCPAGWTLTGGGYRQAGVQILQNYQGPGAYLDVDNGESASSAPAQNSWYVSAQTNPLQFGRFQAWATCMRLAP